MISSAEACHYVIGKPSRKIESESIWKSVRGSKGFNWTRTLCSANSFRDWTQSIPFICFSKYNVWSKFERNGKKNFETIMNAQMPSESKMWTFHMVSTKKHESRWISVIRSSFHIALQLEPFPSRPLYNSDQKTSSLVFSVHLY